MAYPAARRPLLPLLVLALLLATAVSSRSACAALERRHSEEVSAPAVAAAGRARHEFHVARTPAAAPAGTSSRNGATTTSPPIKEWRSTRGGGTGAWAFSAMLPRGFVPPSGSSACHNDMPATADAAQFFACGGAGTP